MAQYPAFTGSTYLSRSLVADTERTINLYPEPIEDGAGKSRSVLYGTPGLTLFATLPVAPVWAMWYSPAYAALNAEQMLVLAGPSASNLNLYVVNSAGSVSSVGALAGGYGTPGYRTYPPWLVASETQALLGGGGLTYANVYTFASGLTTLSGANPGTYIPSATNLDSYWIAPLGNSNTLGVSNPNDATTWQALNTLSLQDGPDMIVALAALRRELWVFGSERTTVYYDSGAVFPFTRIPGAVVSVGCVAPRSLQVIGGSLCFLGTLNGGERGASHSTTGAGCAVYMSSGYNVQRISTFGVESLLSTWTAPENAMSYTYQDAGHTFYVLTCSQGTLVYDVTVGLWHERVSDASSPAHLGQCYVHAFGKHLVGATDGKIYTMDRATYTDAGTAITRTRIGPPIANENHINTFHEFTLDCEVGTEASGAQSLTLGWSNDGGQTWPGSSTISVGAAGNYTARAVWRRLGSARDRVFKVTTTDASPIAWINAYLEMTGGGA